MIDWKRLALSPSIERLGAVLREQFGVWVGFVGEDGRSYPIGGRLVALEREGCRRFISRSVLANQSDETEQTCLKSLRRWAGRAPDAPSSRDAGEPIETSCHAGYSATLYRLDHIDGLGGCVYVSGYVESERAHKDLGRIRDELASLQMFDESAGDEELIDGVPRLDRREREMMHAVAGHLVEEVARLAGDPGAEDDGALKEAERFHGMVAASDEMLELFDAVRTVAGGDSTVLVDGESGTGKELVARALHLESPRLDAPFVALNCAAIPGELIESELFGHQKGAFSGANRDRRGLVEEADGGTLLLDEIGDMDLHLQVKLLRFLQEGTFAPVGANQRRKVDVRVICATNRDIRALVEEGAFRRDLYFRINVIRLQVPPLRKRRSDVELLAEHFLAEAAHRHGGPVKQLSEESLQRLRAYDWPGNVRELENEIERLVIMSGEQEVIGAEYLSERIAPSDEPTWPVESDIELPEAIEQLERAMILQGLRQTGWNKSQAARDLGVSRRTLIRKVDRYELEQFRDD